MKNDDNIVLDVVDFHVRAHTQRGTVHAVNDVSLSIAHGEVLGLVGESGSGKSMLSRSLMGLHNDEGGIQIDGTVTLNSVEVTGAPARELRNRWGNEISIVLQDPLASLNPVRKIGTQLTETVHKHHPKLSRREARDQAESLLRSVGIADPAGRLDVYPHEMSGGMRQRVMIAIALSGDPSVLIADEPTTALDVTVQAQILDLLDQQRSERSMAILFVTHDLSLVAARTDRVAVMYAGEIVEEAPTRLLFEAPLMPYTRALLDAVPTMTGPTHVRLAAIPGTPPDPTQKTSGCKFATRCPIVQERCRTEHPDLVRVAPQHSVRCHFPLFPDSTKDHLEQESSHHD